MTYLLSTLHAAGLTVSLRDGRLVVGPSALLTDELRQAIREGREELLQAVRLRDLDAPWEEVPGDEDGVTPGRWAAFMAAVEKWNANGRAAK